MLKAMYERTEECKSDDLANEDDFEYDFPEDLRVVPKVPGERIIMDYMTGEFFTEKQFENLNFKERLENRRKLCKEENKSYG